MRVQLGKRMSELNRMAGRNHKGSFIIVNFFRSIQAVCLGSGGRRLPYSLKTVVANLLLLVRIQNVY